MVKIGNGSKMKDFIKTSISARFLIDSNGEEHFNQESGVVAYEKGNYNSFETTTIKFDALHDSFFCDECIKLRKLYNNYKDLCEKYATFSEYLLEIYINRKDIALLENEKYLFDCYYLYSLNIKIISRYNGKIYERGYGGRNNINTISNLEKDFISLFKTANAKIEPQRIKTGFYDVILDSEATGLLVHEFVGHLFEADNGLLNIDDVYAKRKIANENISIVDDPTLEYGFGSYSFDDEGTIATKTFIIKNGKMNSLLHTKRTATSMSQNTTSNARSVGFKNVPLARMSNTYMMPCKNDIHPRDLFRNIEKGVYIKGTGDGIGGINATINFREMYMIENGKIGSPIYCMSMVGNIYSILNKIDLIANDLKIFGGGSGGCHKLSQGPLEVSAGGPHIRLRNAMLVPNMKKG